MSLIHLLKDPEWDGPVYKILSKTDTNDDKGGNSGVIVLQEIVKYLPPVDLSHVTPTSDRFLDAEMLIGTKFVACGRVRYQAQTRGQKRTPEYRITDGYQPLRGKSHAGDILILQRSNSHLDRIRMVLVKQHSDDYVEASKLAGERRSGPLDPAHCPVENSVVQREEQDIRDISDGDFKILDPEELQYVEGADRLRRNTLFRKVVLGKYEGRCAVSGLGLATPLKRDGEGRPLPQRYEVEGAHIVPVSRGGPDHIRNGLPLCQTLHWAFDEGMFGVDEDRKIYLPDDVKSDKKNEFIRQYEGKEIAEATDPKYSADNVAFEWHTANVVEKWCPK